MWFLYHYRQFNCIQAAVWLEYGHWSKFIVHPGTTLTWWNKIELYRMPRSCTFCPPVTSFDDASNETLGLAPLKMSVHTPSHADSSHGAVLPAPLTHQDLLHRVFTQHGLGNVSWAHACHDEPPKTSFRALKWIICMGGCIWVPTSGMELICFVVSENTSLPTCSTSPTRHLDGSLANK